MNPSSEQTPDGYDVTIRCEREGCPQVASNIITASSVEEAEAWWSRELNAAGWQVSASGGILCPDHRPEAGVTVEEAGEQDEPAS